MIDPCEKWAYSPILWNPHSPQFHVFLHVFMIYTMLNLGIIACYCEKTGRYAEVFKFSAFMICMLEFGAITDANATFDKTR